MAHRDDLKDDKEPLDEWTNRFALQSLVLIALLIAFFFVLAMVFPSPYNRSAQTQLEQPQPFTRAE